VTNSTNLAPVSDSNVSRYRLVNDRLELIFSKNFGHAFKAIALDSQGRAWIAGGGDDAVYYLNQQGDVINSFNGGGVNGPWGITVDGDDNVWVGNFGPQAPGSNFTDTRVSKLAGGNPATRPPGLQAGDPISPASGYTLPSAGAQVLLHNGQPLYGPDGPPSFAPLQRITAVAIDRAGNLWVTNNWKPDFDIDITKNPGGDGICIFVGLAKPRISG